MSSVAELCWASSPLSLCKCCGEWRKEKPPVRRPFPSSREDTQADLRFLRYARKPSAPRPVTKSGRAPGTGTSLVPGVNEAVPLRTPLPSWVPIIVRALLTDISKMDGPALQVDLGLITVFHSRSRCDRPAASLSGRGNSPSRSGPKTRSPALRRRGYSIQGYCRRRLWFGKWCRRTRRSSEADVPPLACLHWESGGSVVAIPCRSGSRVCAHLTQTV